MPPWWTAVLESCLRRIRTWCVPPNCSPQDWMEEMRAQAQAAAWQALCDFNPARGVPLAAFVRQRVLAGALSRYRQEWVFARRCVFEAEDAEQTNVTTDTLSTPAAYELLGEALAWLPQPDRWLIARLFYDGYTEAEIAGELGLSQRAINKRKQVILQDMRVWLEKPKK